MRLDADLINLLCLDIKLYRFAVADNFFSMLNFEPTAYLFSPFPYAVVIVVSLFVAILS